MRRQPPVRHAARCEFGAVIEQEATEPPWDFPERDETRLTTTTVNCPTGLGDVWNRAAGHPGRAMLVAAPAGAPGRIPAGSPAATAPINPLRIPNPPGEFGGVINLDAPSIHALLAAAGRATRRSAEHPPGPDR